MFFTNRTSHNLTRAAFGVLRQPKFYYRVCPVVKLWLPRLVSWQKWALPKFYYRVWKNTLPALLFFAMVVVVLPFVANAACPNPPESPNAFPNPICATTFLELIQSVAKAVRMIAVPFAVIAIIIVGFRFVAAAAGGKVEEVAKARKLFLWVLIGSAIIVGATVLVGAVINTIKTL